MNINISLLNPIDYSEYRISFLETNLERKGVFFKSIFICNTEIQILGSFSEYDQKEFLDSVIFLGDITLLIPNYLEMPIIDNADDLMIISFSNYINFKHFPPEELKNTYYEGIYFSIDPSKKNILSIHIPKYLINQNSNGTLDFQIHSY